MNKRLSIVLLGLAACGGSGGAGDTTDAGGADAMGQTADATPADPSQPALPRPTGTCPTLFSGDVTFAPAGMAPRKVKLALPTTSSIAPGELIFYWHATGSDPVEAAYSLGSTEDAIRAAGGTVAAPYADPSAGEFEWFIVNQSMRQDDFLLMDEVVGCLDAAGYVDSHHIHSMGMSAGALQTTAVSFVRAQYVASVATYSGGIPPGFTPVNADPTNKFAALIFDGGSGDDVFGVDFEAASESYQSTLEAAGHFAPICDHGGGHSIPLDAAPSVADFFAHNGWGAWPSPYAGGLPASYPTYCTL